MATRPTDYGGLRDLHKDQGPSRPAAGPQVKTAPGLDHVSSSRAALQDVIGKHRSANAQEKGQAQEKLKAHVAASRGQRGSTEAGKALSDHLGKAREGKTSAPERGKGGPADGKGWER